VAVLAITTIVGASAVFLAGPWIHPLAFGIESAPTMFLGVLAIVPIAASAAHIYLSSVLIARGRSGAAALVPIAGASAFLIAAYPAVLAIRAGYLAGYFGSFIAGSVFSLLCATALLGRSSRLQFFSDFRLDSFQGAEARGFLGSALALFAASAIGSFILLWARLVLAHEQGLITAGLFETAWLLSALFSTIVTSGLMAALLPRLSRARSTAELSGILEAGLHIVVMITAPAIALLIVSKPLVLRALFDEEFLAAGAMWQWMLVGDFARVLGWTLMLPLLALKRRRAYLTLEVGSSVVLLGGFAIALNVPRPLEGLGIAYLAMCFTYVAVASALVYPKIAVRPKPKTIGLALLGFATILILSSLTWEMSTVDMEHFVGAIVLSALIAAIALAALRQNPTGAARL
jgi:O-antigen/teichoic acid export membrane protein